MHHQGYARPSAGLHHPHGFKAKLHHHHLRLMATDQGKGHTGCRQASQMQPIQTREKFADEDGTAVGQSPRRMQGKVIAEVGRQVK